MSDPIEKLTDDNTRLKREARASMITIEKLLKNIQELKEKIKHLEGLVAQKVPIITTPVDKIQRLDITPEESIAEVQLARLREIALQRQLTLEETRIYDLLVKNKRLSQDQATINLGKTDYREVSSPKLLEIVGNVTHGDESD